MESQEPSLYDADAQYGLMCAILQDFQPETVLAAVRQAVPRLDVGHFDTRTGFIWRAILDLEAQRLPINLLSVRVCLEQHNWLDNAGGLPYLLSFQDEVVHIGAAPYYATRVYDHWRTRHKVDLLSNMAAAAYSNDTAAYARYQAELAALDKEPTAKRRGFLTAEEVEDLPPMEWLISGMLPAGCTSCFYGPRGGGKTFSYLSMAGAVVTGRPWFGRKTKQGLVAVVAAEGLAGMRYRVRALRESMGVPKGQFNLRIVGEPYNLLTPEGIALLLQDLRELPEPPIWVILDTLARLSAGADENAVKDMGRFVDAMDSIKREFGCQTTVVHHSGKDGTLRGSTALPAAFETLVRIEHPSEGSKKVQVSCEKQKDGAEEFKAITLELQRIVFEQEPEITTCILIPAKAAPEIEGSALKPAEQQALLALKDEMRSVEWKNASGLAESSFYKYVLPALIGGGYVTKHQERYYLSPIGKAELSLLSKHFQESS